jgi:hypothetical protein
MQTLIRTTMRKVLVPLIQRAGTAAAAVLIAHEVDQGTVQVITDGLMAAGLVAIDLVGRNWLKV